MRLSNQNWFVPTAAFLLAGGLLIVLTQFGRLSVNSAPETTGSVLTAEPASYDFGTISMAAGKVRQTFTVINPTNAPIRLISAETSCMCTEMMLMDSQGNHLGTFGMNGHGQRNADLNYELPAGGSILVEAVFDPAAHGPAGVGPIERQLKLHSSAGSLVISIKAVVKP